MPLRLIFVLLDVLTKIHEISGDGARLAARSAVQGCLEYLDKAILGQGAGKDTFLYSI